MLQTINEERRSEVATSWHMPAFVSRWIYPRLGQHAARGCGCIQLERTLACPDYHLCPNSVWLMTGTFSMCYTYYLAKQLFIILTDCYGWRMLSHVLSFCWKNLKMPSPMTQHIEESVGLKEQSRMGACLGRRFRLLADVSAWQRVSCRSRATHSLFAAVVGAMTSWLGFFAVLLGKDLLAKVWIPLTHALLDVPGCCSSLGSDSIRTRILRGDDALSLTLTGNCMVSVQTRVKL